MGPASIGKVVMSCLSLCRQRTAIKLYPRCSGGRFAPGPDRGTILVHSRLRNRVILSRFLGCGRLLLLGLLRSLLSLTALFKRC